MRLRIKINEIEKRQASEKCNKATSRLFGKSNEIGTALYEIIKGVKK